MSKTGAIAGDGIMRETFKEATEMHNGEFKIKGNSLDFLVAETFTSLGHYFLVQLWEVYLWFSVMFSENLWKAALPFRRNST